MGAATSVLVAARDPSIAGNQALQLGSKRNKFIVMTLVHRNGSGQCLFIFDTGRALTIFVIFMGISVIDWY